MEVKLETTPTLRVVAPDRMVTPTARIYAPDGSLLASPTPTLPDVDTVIAGHADNTADRFVIETVGELARGMTLRVTDPRFGTADAIVSMLERVPELAVPGIDPRWVTLKQPLPEVPDVDSLVHVLDVFVPLPAEATSSIERARKIEVTEGDVSAELVFHVMRWPVGRPCKGIDVRTVLARRHAAEQLDEQACEDLADEVNDEIAGLLSSSHTYVSAYWDPAAVRRLLRPLINWVLAEEHEIYPANEQRDAYLARQLKRISDLKGELLKSAEEYDTDLDGELEEPEKKGVFGTQMVR